MFRESSAIDSERTAKSVGSLYAKYSADENWFNGSPDSVDRRIAQAKKISNLCKAASVRLSGRNASSQYIALAREMDGDRADLEGLRRDLLTAAADRDEATSVDELIGPPYAEDYQDKFERHPNPKMQDEDEYDSGEGPGYIEWLKKNRQEPEDTSFDEATKHLGMRSEARHFIAEQECDDLRELTIRAQNYAERTASILPASQYRAFVASFVGAVRDEYRTAAKNYAHKTANRTASTDFPAEFLYME
jgi:hypothetical protein